MIYRNGFLPRRVLALPSAGEEEAHRVLMQRSAQALGVASERDLRDYFRLDVAPARKALSQLLESGDLNRVAVEGWKLPGYMDSGARIPRAAPEVAVLLSPFDSLIWERNRLHRLFDFHYRLEIYTPAHKRVHGYYVLPFLYKDRIVARVDLKADRGSGTLRVLGRHFELEAGNGAREALGAALRELAAWLGLERVR